METPERDDEQQDETVGENEEFSPEDIENDPAYNPDDQDLKDLKGG